METKDLDEQPTWTEAKDIYFKKVLEEFKTSNNRLPTTTEEHNIWEMIFYMKNLGEK